jgi:6-pyruvoyltetrahydropterin/6-carboxytetrahydropterin synthase
MTTITRRLEADIGHRLLKHEGKCRNLHGHRYVFEVTVAGKLDVVGRVIDFSVVKEIVGGWIDEYWDHGFIGQEGDPLLQVCRDLNLKHFELRCPPTAENLAQHVFAISTNFLSGRALRVMKVVCRETPNGRAEYVLDP